MTFILSRLLIHFLIILMVVLPVIPPGAHYLADGDIAQHQSLPSYISLQEAIPQSAPKEAKESIKVLVAAGTTALVAENKDKASAAITAAGTSVFNELMINSVAPVEETAIATHNAEIAHQEGTPLAATDKDRFSAMQAVNNFSQLANRCISGLAGFQGRSQQAFELGASIPAMTHAKAVEERVDQLREIRAQTLQAQMQKEEEAALSKIKKAPQEKEEVAKEEAQTKARLKAEKEAEHQETILALMNEGAAKEEFVIKGLGYSTGQSMEDSKTPATEYVSFRKNKKAGGIPELDFRAMHAYQGSTEILSPSSRSALNNYRDAYQRSLESVGTFRFHDEDPLFDPHQEATTAYILEQNRISGIAAERLNGGGSISAYEAEVIHRVQHDRANVISQTANNVAMAGTVAVGLITSAPALVVTAAGVGLYATAGGISAAARHNFDLSTPKSQEDVWRSTGLGALDGANLTGAVDVFEGVRNEDFNQVSDGIQRLVQDQARFLKAAKSSLVSQHTDSGNKGIGAPKQAVGDSTNASTTSINQQYNLSQQPQTLKPTSQHVKFEGVDMGKNAVGVGEANPYAHLPQEMTLSRNANGKLKVAHTQEHHIIHQKLKDHELFAKAGMTVEDPANKMLLPTKEGTKYTTTQRSVHEGPHLKVVRDGIEGKMNDIIRKGNREGYNQSQYRQALQSIMQQERAALKSGETLLNNATDFRKK